MPFTLSRTITFDIFLLVVLLKKALMNIFLDPGKKCTPEFLACETKEA